MISRKLRAMRFSSQGHTVSYRHLVRYSIFLNAVLRFSAHKRTLRMDSIIAHHLDDGHSVSKAPIPHARDLHSRLYSTDEDKNAPAHRL